MSGGELARRALTQAKRFGAEVILTQSVQSVRVEGPYKFVTLSDGAELSCHALVIASGVSYRKLDVPGMDSLTGAGVYYGAATTEAAACHDQDVIVVGGGNSAGQGAMFLSRYARSVTIAIRGTGLEATMSRYLIDQIGQTPNIRLRPCTEVAAVAGRRRLENVTLRDLSTGSEETVPAGALFIYIGAEPRHRMAGRCGDPRRARLPPHRTDAAEGRQAPSRMDARRAIRSCSRRTYLASSPRATCAAAP